MDYRLKQAYQQVLNKQVALSESKQKAEPKTVKDAYRLVHEKLAFYTKEYPEDATKSDEFEGFKNLGFVGKEHEQEAIQTVKSQNFKKLIRELFALAGWVTNNEINIRDFDYGFLNPIAQQFVASGLTLEDLEQIVNIRRGLDGLNTSVHEHILNHSIFNLFYAINQDYENLLSNSILDTFLTRSGKTVNDVAFGQGEVLLTVLSGYKKPKNGDLALPNGQRIEMKISGGRICGPQDVNNNFKQQAKQFLIKGGKEVDSQSFKQKASEADVVSNEIYKFLIDDQEIKGVLSEPFKEELLEILTSSTTSAEKIEQLKQFQTTNLNFNSMSIDAALSHFTKNDLLGQNFNPTDRKIFKNVYGRMKTFVKNIISTLGKTKKTIYETSLTTFLKNFFVEDYGLTIDEVAELYTFVVHFASEADRKYVKEEIIKYLSENNRFEQLRSNKSISEAIIFAIQIYVYSKNHFEYLLIINKNTSQTLGIDCRSNSEGQSRNIVESLLSTFEENKGKMTMDITADFRGGSQLYIV